MSSAPKELRIKEYLVGNPDHTIYDAEQFRVYLNDFGGGEFVSVKTTDMETALHINPGEWESLKRAIDLMVDACRDDE